MDEVLVGATHYVVVGNGDGVDTASWRLQDVDTLQGPDVPDLEDVDGDKTNYTVDSQCWIKKKIWDGQHCEDVEIEVNQSVQSYNLFNCVQINALCLLLWKGLHVQWDFFQIEKIYVVSSMYCLSVKSRFFGPDTIYSKQIRLQVNISAHYSGLLYAAIKHGEV